METIVFELRLLGPFLFPQFETVVMFKIYYYFYNYWVGVGAAVVQRLLGPVPDKPLRFVLFIYC